MPRGLTHPLYLPVYGGRVTAGGVSRLKSPHQHSFSHSKGCSVDGVKGGLVEKRQQVYRRIYTSIDRKFR